MVGISRICSAGNLFGQDKQPGRTPFFILNIMKKAYFGQFGGQFVPETLMPALQQLERGYKSFKKDKQVMQDYLSLLKSFVGRPTPLYFAKRLSEKYSNEIYLKREDMCHTGAHKINNALGQALLAKYMGKSRVIAETGAGQHGVATAAACAMLGLECVVYMGKVDMERQKPNVFRMKMFGACVVPVESGSQTLKDAVNEAIRDWITNINTSHYLLGSALGPHPYPRIVRDFQKIIGQETRRQLVGLPDYIIACVGGGSNSIGIFTEFLDHRQVGLIGVEAGGKGMKPGQHAARFAGGKIGILHGSKSLVLQDRDGQILPTHSVSAGLDYPSVGPEHAYLGSQGRVKYVHVSDKQALRATAELSELEGILPALESAHALAYSFELCTKVKDKTIVINLSGRGDKDLETLML